MKCYVVDSAALIENTRLVCAMAAPAKVWAVVKGDGYGLGVLSLANILRSADVHRFAVTEVSEARTLRENGFEQEQILMLRATADPKELEQLIQLRVIATIGTPEDAAALEQTAECLHCTAYAHVALDTGMGRYGFLPNEMDSAGKVWQLNSVIVCGVYTHFSCAFCSKKKTEKQYTLFQTCLKQLREKGCDTGEIHCANSSAVFRFPEMNCDAVRVGSALLGRLSFSTDAHLSPIGWAEAEVEELRRLPKGWGIGYGAGYRTKKETEIAVIGVGYYHGFGLEKGRDLFRFSDTVRGCLSLVKALLTRRKLYVTIDGKRCPILGHVGMLHCVADVTGLQIQRGAKVRLEINPLNRKGLPVEYR